MKILPYINKNSGKIFLDETNKSSIFNNLYSCRGGQLFGETNNQGIIMSVLEIFAFERISSERIPLYAMSVSAGLPVPVENDVDKVIDLNEFLVEHPVATFFARVKGDTLNAVGIQNDDILIVDTAVEPTDGKTVIASINNELTVKIYREIKGEVYLQSNNNQFVPKTIGSEIDYEIIGIVSKVIHSL